MHPLALKKSKSPDENDPSEANPNPKEEDPTLLKNPLTFNNPLAIQILSVLPHKNFRNFFPNIPPLNYKNTSRFSSIVVPQMSPFLQLYITTHLTRFLALKNMFLMCSTPKEDTC